MGIIHNISAPPHPFVRPGPFLSPPGHWPMRSGPNVWRGSTGNAPHIKEGLRVTTRAQSAGKTMATKSIDFSARKKANPTISRRIRKIFGNIHEISEMPNLIEVQRESYEQFLRSDPATGYVSGLEKTLR